MNSDAYSKFLGSVDGSGYYRQAGTCSGVRNSELSRVSSSVKNAHNRLGEALEAVEMGFSAGGGKVCWAVDFDDLFAQLAKLVRQHNVDSYSIMRAGNDGVFEELGVRYFFEDKGIAEKAVGAMRLWVVDMLIADEGYAMMVDNVDGVPTSGGRGGVDVFIATIDKVGVSLADAAHYASLKGKGGMALVRGGRGMYLFLVDNGRTNVFSKPVERGIMACAGCGRCKEVCPVSVMVGGRKGYDNVLWGPTGSVLLPRMEDEDEYAFVSMACTMCGRCEEVCPMQLNIRDMILACRANLVSERVFDKEDARRLRVLRWLLSSRRWLNSGRGVRDVTLRWLRWSGLKAWLKGRGRLRLPLAKKSFNARVVKGNEK